MLSPSRSESPIGTGTLSFSEPPQLSPAEIAQLGREALDEFKKLILSTPPVSQQQIDTLRNNAIQEKCVERVEEQRRAEARAWDAWLEQKWGKN